MRHWVRGWIEARGGAAAYFAARAVPGLDGAEVARVVAEDLAAGVQRERLLFALILLVEWHAAQQPRLAALALRYAAAG